MSWDVCPNATEVTQGWGCTDVAMEWFYPACGEPPRFHTGIDLGTAPGAPSLEGAPIVCTRPGTVTAIGDPYGGPYAVEWTLSTGLVLRALHCSSTPCTVGDTLTVGEELAKVGSLGVSSGPHLHFEARFDHFQGPGTPAHQLTTDPAPYLMFPGVPGHSEEDEMLTYTLFSGQQKVVPGLQAEANARYVNLGADQDNQPATVGCYVYDLNGNGLGSQDLIAVPNAPNQHGPQQASVKFTDLGVTAGAPFTLLLVHKGGGQATAVIHL